MASMEIDLTILHGRDLPVKDVTTSDPYVVFTIDNKPFKTKVVNNTINPDWDQKFKFATAVGKVITFNVWDKDVVGDDDKMGNCTWTVPMMTIGQEEIYVLKNDMRGQITIKVKCLTGGKEPASAIELKPKRAANSVQTLLFQIQSVEKVEQAYEAEKLKDPQREVLQLKGVSAVSLCGIEKLVSTKELSAEKRKKLDSKDFYFTTSQDLEKIEISLIASQKAKKGNESICARGTFMAKLMRDKEREFHRIEMTSGVVLYFTVQCFKSVWDEVKPEAVDKYFAEVEKNLNTMKAKGMYASVQFAAPEKKKAEPKKEEKKEEPKKEEPKKEEPKPAEAPAQPAAQPMMQQQPMMQPGMMSQPQMMQPGMMAQPGMVSVAQPGMMQPGMMAQPMMGSMSVAQPGMMVQQPMMGSMSVAQPGMMVQQPMMGSISVAQPGIAVARPAVVATSVVQPGVVVPGFM